MAATIGLDIGADTVRAVELRRRGGRWEIRRAVEVARHDENGVRRPLALVLATVDSRLGLKGRLRVANSQLKVMVRYLPTIPMPQDRLDRLLRLEMQQQAGTEDELAADAQVLPIGGDEMFHCCAFAQPEEVRGLLAELDASGIRPYRVSIAPVALGNVVATSQLLDGDGYGLIVDIGAKATSVVLQRGNDFQACRQLPMGGDDFTEALAKEWKVRFERAEQAKVRGDVVAGAQRPDDAAPLGDGIVRADTPAQLFTPNAGEAREGTGRNDEVDGTGRPQAKTASYDPAPSAVEDDGQESDPLSARYEADAGEGAIALQDADADTDPFSHPLNDQQEATPSSKTVPARAAAKESISIPGVPVTVFAHRGGGDKLLGDLNAVDRELAAAGREGMVAAVDDFDPLAETQPGEDEESWRRNEDGVPVTAPALPSVGMQTMRQAALTLGPELMRTAERMVAQINASLAWFQSQLKLKRIEVKRVLVCGGGADLLGLTAYFERRFRIPCALLDPCCGLGGVRPEQAHRFATAIGLALAETPSAYDFDVRPEGLLRRRLFWAELVWPRVAAVLILVGTVIMAAFLYYQTQWNGQESERYRVNAKKHQELERQLTDLVNARQGLRKDFNAIVGRLFGGRDMLMTIRALKVNAPEGLWCQEFRTTSLSSTRVIAEEKKPDERGGDRPTTVDAGKTGGNPPTDGRGEDRRKEAPSQGEILYDTLLDRGSLYLRGFVKPEGETGDMHTVFQQWIPKVEHWIPPGIGDGLPLFQNHEILRSGYRPDARGGEDEFIFEVRFDFHPGRLTQVAKGD